MSVIKERTWVTSKGETKAAWVVIYTDGSGKRRLKTFRRKAAAKDFQIETDKAVKDGTHTSESESVTIEQAVENWISRCETKKHPCERSTVESYRRTMKLHVVPFIGKLKLAKLDTSALAKLEDQLRAAGRSALMVKVSLHFLSMMLKDAKRRGHCAQNVARDYQADASSDRKAERRARGRLRAGVDIPSRDEIRAIVTALDGRWRGIILTAVFTGLRSSEMRGLRWSCIDFAKSELHVRERVDQYGAFGKPKSAAGERTVPSLCRRWS
jgi:integrase